MTSPAVCSSFLAVRLCQFGRHRHGICIALAVAFSQPIACARGDRGVDVIADALVIGRRSLELGVLESTKRDNEVLVVFRWRNDSTRTLKVRAAEGACPVLTTVSCSRSLLQPGETTDIAVRCDMSQQFGEREHGARVLFEEDAAPPVELAITFFRPQPPTAYPDRIDFGDMRNSDRGRPIVVSATLPPDRGDSLTLIADKITSTNPSVSCKLISREEIPSMNSDRITSIRPTYRLMVRANSSADCGPFTGTILLPFTLDGNNIELRVPFSGQCLPELSLRPSRLLLFVNSLELEGKASAGIYWAGDGDAPEDIAVSCQSSFIDASFTPSSNSRSETRQLIGHIDVSLKNYRNRSFSADILIEAHSHDRSFRLSLPVKVQVVEARSDHNQ